MGSPTWTRAKIVFWILLVSVLLRQFQYDEFFRNSEPYEENAFSWNDPE